MRSFLSRNKWAICLVMTLATHHAHRARAQSNAPMTSDPGADITVVVDIEVETSLYGTDTEVDQGTAPVTGTAVLTLFPTDPPFTHCRIHSLSFDVGQIELSYLLFFFIRVDATFTNLRIESSEPFDGTIDTSGNLLVPVAPMRVTGRAHILSQALTIDEVIDIDATSTASVSAVLGGVGREVLMEGIVLPAVEWIVPADMLPTGITSLKVNVATDASRIVLRGPYTPTPLGDSNADNMVDLRDWKDLVTCLDDPSALTNSICPVFYFDQDNDVDLRDAADFLLKLSHP